MPRRVCALLALWLLPACSPRLAGPFHQDRAPSSDAALTAQARTALLDALASAEPVGDAWLAPDVVLSLPRGETVRGRAPVLARLRAVTAGVPRDQLSFDLARTRACTGALHDVGMLLAGTRDDAHADWHASLLWRRGPEGSLRVEAADLRDPADFSLYRTRVCVPLPDSVFRSHRVSLLIEPGYGAVVGDAPVAALRDELIRTQWLPPCRPSLSACKQQEAAVRERTPLLRGIGVRVDLTRSLFSSATLGVLSADAVGTHADQSTARLEYDGVHLALQAGMSAGWLHASAGPAFLRVSGDWTMTGSTGAPAPSDEAWSAWSVGAVGEGGLLIPISGRTGIDLAARYRRFPEPEVPGYRASGTMAIDFSHWAAAASVAVRF